MTDLRQSKEYASYLKSIGWKVEKIDNTFVYLKHLPLLGWFIKIQRPSILDKKIMDFFEDKYHPFQISYEPLKIDNSKLIENCKLKIVNSPSLPTKTLQIDLTKSKEELLKSFSQKTRYNIKLSQRKNIKVQTSSDVFAFTKFWRQNFESKRFPFMSQQKNITALHKAFGKNSHILFAKKGNTIIASVFLIFYDKVSYYLYAAASDAGRGNFAPTLLTWHAILLAKKSGMKIFDFDGMYDERFPIKSWLGFTKFKKGFGGKEVKYPGRFVKTKLFYL